MLIKDEVNYIISLVNKKINKCFINKKAIKILGFILMKSLMY